MTKSHFQLMAAYGVWANQRLTDACQALSEDAYHADRNAFFGSIHGTLNHILVGDRIWLGRITGVESGLTQLDARLFDTRDGLAAARAIEDQRMISVIDGMTEEAFAGSLTYSTLVKPETLTTPMSHVLSHLFNHATHHRGQVHGLLSQVPLTPPSLDLIVYLRQPKP